MSEIDQIEESLRIADEVLSTASLEDKDDFLKSISEEYLVKTFEKNVDFKTVLNDLFPDISYIRKYRSSYLPTEFFLSRDEGGTEEIVDFADSLESYENTFMRLLGMPNIIRLVDGNPKGDTIDDILVPDFVTGELKQVSFSTLVTEVLDERQRVGSQRRVRVDPETIFNIGEDYAGDDSTQSLQAEDWESLRQVSGITSSIYDVNAGDSAITSGAFFAKIDQLHEDFLKFSYLLFPPVQDHRIATRINEPSKIVGEPFSNSFSSINGKRVRPPLLESIIRIRLDRLSGTRIDTQDTGFEDAISSLGPDAPNYLNSNNYGLLESIIIKRLDASVNALARLCELKIKNLKEELSKTGTIIKNPKFASNASSDKKIQTDSSLNSTAAQSGGFEGSDEESGNGKTIDQLNAESEIDQRIEELTNQKNVEDAILALLSFEPTVGSISAIDEQINTLRNSSINDAHLSSAFLSILKAQSKHVNSKLEELQKLKKEGSSAGTIPKGAAELSTLIGIDIGIGTLDILAYVFALFVLDEASLLGLLPKKSFEYLKTEYNSLLEGTATQQSLTESINNLTKLVLNVYRRFQKKLKES